MATERIKDFLNTLNIDFVRYRYIAAAGSILLVVLSWTSFFVWPGPQWGIDFTGGTEIQMEFKDAVKIEEIRTGLTSLGLSEDSVQQFGPVEDHTFIVRVDDASFGMEEARLDVERRIAEAYGPGFIESTTIDAEVGAKVTVRYKGEPVRAEDVGKLFADMEGVVVRPGSGIHENELVVQIPGMQDEIAGIIGKVLPGHAFDVVRSESVGPKVGGELKSAAALSVVATLALVLMYIAFRFDLAFAPGAILALIHDASMIAGAFVLFGKEFNLSIIGAILTIIGYSLNDTVVVYDRMRENREKYRRIGTAEIINRSVNETLGRTITTAGATMLAILPFIVMGGSVVADFAFAMALGIFFGSYSTIYVASPMILVMEELKPYLQRFVVTASGPTAAPAAALAAAASAEVAPEQPAAPLTESEKRRRERAEKEREAQRAQSRGGR